MIRELTWSEKYAVAPIARQLTNAFAVISQAFSNTAPLLKSLNASQHLIQAIPPSGSPLLQLPYFTPAVVRAIEEGKTKTHMSLSEFMSLSVEKRKKLSIGPGLLTPQQFQTAMTTAAQLPQMKIEKTMFKVSGERYITPNSLVQLVVKFRFVPFGATNIPPVNEKDLEDNDKDEEDKETFTPLLAHAPYYSRDHSPIWYMFLGEPKMGRIAVPPFTYTTFDKPIFTADGEPTYNMQTIRMQFGAPPGPGDYTFSMHLINDSYVGLDIKQYVTLTVDDASRAEEMEDDGEISEPDEGKGPFAAKSEPKLIRPDSLAGQMRALKSGKMPAPVVDSDESDTEGEIDDDTSDTNTDTDEE